ncbi:DUF3616 domain-containing protein [Massilia consociata]|uniref:DUF3616 domain-containing protein n=1 Tax=Massilia consociata TaxID=760117 RepID=A0ABV6FF15_9BURK
MHPSNIVLLTFHPERDELSPGKELRDGLSVALRMGRTLWLANDESVSLERLTLCDEDSSGNTSFTRDHKQFALHDYLELPLPPYGEKPGETPLDGPDGKPGSDPGNDMADRSGVAPGDAGIGDSARGRINEADIEGLACDGKYLWLVGSHSLRRKQPKAGDGVKKAHKRLASVSADGNRYLLARIPVVEENGLYSLAVQHMHKDKPRSAALLRGDEHGNELTALLKDDVHLGPFLAIPGKDNGFDIEGIAVAGKHLLLGLRGPVLRGWAIVIEVAPVEDDRPGRLRLGPLGDDGQRYRKHFLDLHGLGIRDLCLHGQDVLVLAGPTMDLDGPVTVFRWRGGARLGTKDADKECVVAADQLERVLDLPFGQGVDHPEGITLFSSAGGGDEALLVVHDSAAPSRQIGESILLADVYPLPQRRKQDK